MQLLKYIEKAKMSNILEILLWKCGKTCYEENVRSEIEVQE